MNDDEPKVRVNGVPIGARIVTKLMERDMLLCAAQQQAAELAQLRAERDKMDADTLIKQAIASYELRHKQNRKITLRQVCEEFGVNYGSTRVLKSRYAKQKRKHKVNSKVNKAD